METVSVVRRYPRSGLRRAMLRRKGALATALFNRRKDYYYRDVRRRSFNLLTTSFPWRSPVFCPLPSVLMCACSRLSRVQVA